MANEEEVFLNTKQLKELLLDLSDTKYWSAIIFYFNNLRSKADDILRSTDAFKEPTTMARTQGYIQACNALAEYIDIIKGQIEEKIKQDENNK